MSINLRLDRNFFMMSSICVKSPVPSQFTVLNIIYLGIVSLKLKIELNKLDCRIMRAIVLIP